MPASFLTPTVTKARDLLRAGDVLENEMDLRRVINLPADLDELPRSVLPGIKRFLQWAKRQGGDQCYTARHRSAWWAVGIKAPAHNICKSVARCALALVLKPCYTRPLNTDPGHTPRSVIDTTTPIGTAT